MTPTTLTLLLLTAETPPATASDRPFAECLDRSSDVARAACIDQMPPAALEKAQKQDVDRLSPEVMARLSGPSQAALARASGAKDGDSAAAVMLRDRDAIRPSVRIVGDAFGRVATGNQQDDAPQASTDGALGGGLDVRTLSIRASLMIKKGTQPRTITGEQAFGTSILMPQTENFAVTSDFTWFPDWYAAHCAVRRKRGTLADTWCSGQPAPDGRDAWRYQLRRNLLLGPSFTFNVARTDWKHVLRAAEGAGDTMLPELAVTGQVTTLHTALGLRYSWLRSHNDNWVEVSVFAGASWRGVRVDPGADKALAAVWDDPPPDLDDSPFRAAGGDFLRSALGTSRRDFFGVDLGLSVRVNDVVISALLPYVAGQNVSGLDGFRLVPMLSIRSGFELVKLGTEAKRTPKKDPPAQKSPETEKPPAQKSPETKKPPAAAPSTPVATPQPAPTDPPAAEQPPPP